MTDYEEYLFPRNHCVIAFASDSQQKYEFGRTLRAVGVPHVLMRDSNTKWYQNGVDGIGNKEAVIEYIMHLVTKYDCVTTIGVSSGAYAALFYGQLAGVDKCIVISPVTGKEADDFDPKWRHRIEPALGYVDPSPIDDLRKHFKDGPVPKIKAFISDAPDAEIDRQMAERIGITDISVIPGYTHSTLARGMRDSGMLADLLRS